MASSARSELAPQLIIDKQYWWHNYWQDTWQLRQVVLGLVNITLRERYRQTLIGLLWLVVKPMLMIIVMTFVFHTVAKLQPQASATSYWGLTFAAIFAWQQFSSSIEQSHEWLVGYTTLLTNRYFPRILLILSRMVVCFIDALMLSGLIMILVPLGVIKPTIHMWFLPVAMLWSFLLAMGSSTWIALLSVQFRDIRFLIPYGLILLLYVSPVAYPSSYVPPKYQVLYALNPLAGVIDFYRWTLCGSAESYSMGFTMLMSLLVTALLLVSSIGFLIGYEGSMMDDL